MNASVEETVKSGQKLCPDLNHSLNLHQPRIPFLSKDLYLNLSWHWFGLGHNFWPQVYMQTNTSDGSQCSLAFINATLCTVNQNYENAYKFQLVSLVWGEIISSDCSANLHRNYNDSFYHLYEIKRMTYVRIIGSEIWHSFYCIY